MVRSYDGIVLEIIVFHTTPNKAMSIHINLTPEAETERRRAAYRNRIASLLTCLLTVGLGAAALYFSVIMLEEEQLTSFVVYYDPADDAPPSTVPKVTKLTSRPASPTSSVTPNVIVSTSAGAVAMADVEVPISDDNFNTGVVIKTGMGEALPSDFSDVSEGLGIVKGGGSTLEGTFYDLKLTKSGSKTDLASWNEKGEPSAHAGKVTKVLSEFITKDWSPTVLAKYYRSPTKLYAGSFYLPSCDAAYAPVAYKCADHVKPQAWVAIYKGKVQAPKSGKFRFVGTGDDVLAVRFNRKTALEAGWCIPSRNDNTIGSPLNAHGKKYYEEVTRREENPVTYYQYPETPKWNHELGGLTAGDVFEVKEGKVYPIEILISEIPGGAFGFALLIEDMTDPTDKKASNGSPILQLFRTNFQEPTKASLEAVLKTPEKDYKNGRPTTGTA